MERQEKLKSTDNSGVGVDAPVRPPIGVKPKILWLEERILELSGAINNHVVAGIYNETVHSWISELYDVYVARAQDVHSKERQKKVDF